MRPIGLLALTFVLPLSAFADVVWMDIRADVAYRDPSTACTQKASIGSDVYLALEIQDGAVVRGKMRRGMSMPTSEVTLTAEEAQSIQLQQDPNGGWWMKKWDASSRLTIFIMRNLGFLGGCVPSTVAQVDQTPVVFDFKATGLGEDLLLNISEKAKFSGKRKDGQPFKAEMIVHQRIYQ